MRRIALTLLALVPVAVAQQPVTDLEKSRAFYDAIDIDVELVVGEPEADPVARVVERSDLGAVERRLARENVPFDERFASPSGARSLFVTDPDGYVTIFRTPRDAEATAVPATGELNPIVLEVIARYPTDGTHPYWWPRGTEGKGWTGCTKDLEYAGEVFAEGDGDGRAYCCGLTFEVFVDAWRVWCQRNGRPWRIADLDTSGVRRLQRQWFGSAADKTCIRTALVDNGLGIRIEDWSEAQSGDFVQLWRENGSGHSVVFLDWVRDGDEVVGLRYWSTQPATDGIGERVEYFDRGEKGVLRDEFYLCRVGVEPRQR